MNDGVRSQGTRQPQLTRPLAQCGGSNTGRVSATPAKEPGGTVRSAGSAAPAEREEMRTAMPDRWRNASSPTPPERRCLGAAQPSGWARKTSATILGQFSPETGPGPAVDLFGSQIQGDLIGAVQWRIYQGAAKEFGVCDVRQFILRLRRNGRA